MQIEELVVTRMRVFQTLLEINNGLPLYHIVVLVGQVYSLSEDECLRYISELSIHLDIYLVNSMLSTFLADLFDRTETDLRRINLNLFFKLVYFSFNYFFPIECELIFVRLSETPGQHEKIHIFIDHHC